MSRRRRQAVEVGLSPFSSPEIEASLADEREGGEKKEMLKLSGKLFGQVLLRSLGRSVADDEDAGVCADPTDSLDH